MRCYKCNDDLTGKPKIEIEQQAYCYKCAKSEVLRRDGAAIANIFTEFDQKKRGYEQRKQAFYDKHNEWLKRRNKYCELGSLGCIGGIILTVMLGFVASQFSFKLIWVGVIVAFILYMVISSYIEGKRHNQFIITDPEPTFSEAAPIFEFAPKRVSHHPFESDGTQLSSSYYREEILNRDNNTCQCCRKKRQRRFLEVHHIIPRAKGGTNDPTNLITLCHSCHDNEKWYGHHRAFPKTKKPRRRYY